MLPVNFHLLTMTYAYLCKWVVTAVSLSRFVCFLVSRWNMKNPSRLLSELHVFGCRWRRWVTLSQSVLNKVCRCKVSQTRHEFWVRSVYSVTLLRRPPQADPAPPASVTPVSFLCDSLWLISSGSIKLIWSPPKNSVASCQGQRKPISVIEVIKGISVDEWTTRFESAELEGF